MPTASIVPLSRYSASSVMIFRGTHSKSTPCKVYRLAEESTTIAAEEYQQENPGKRVFVLDSLSTGPEQRLLAEHLRDLLAEGKEFDEICEEMLRYHKHTHLLFSLESLANLARNGRVKPAVAAVARMLGIRVIGQASDAGELDVLCKTRGEHGALERIVLELKGHGFTNGRVYIGWSAL